MIFYCNGHYSDKLSKVQINDRGLMLGDGVFDTVLVRKGVIVFLEDHLKRLQSACTALMINMDVQALDVQNIVSALKEKNVLTCDDISARITITRGPAKARGLLFAEPEHQHPTVLITIAPLAVSVKAFSYHISDYRRASISLTSSYKTINYLDNVMARNAANIAGFDEAVMLNENKLVACGSYTNVFVILEDSRLVTPRLEDGALAGITRQYVLVEAKKLNLTVEERALTVEELQLGEVFFTNSLIGLVSAHAGVSQIFNQLKEAYCAAVQDYVERKDAIR